MNYAIVFTGFLGQILLQFALQWILARRFGTSMDMDAYMAALTLPIAASAILAGGIAPLMVTALNRNAHRDDRSSPVGLLLSGTLVIACLSATLCLVWARPLMAWLHPGFDAAMTDRAVNLFQVLVWLIPANTAIGLFQAILNGQQQFALPAAAGVLGPLTTVLVIAGFADRGGIQSVAWGTLAGTLVNIATQFPSLIRSLPPAGIVAAFRACREMVPLAVPIFVGMFLLKVDPLIDRYVSSYLDEGSISRYGYATRIVTIFIMLASGTLSTVSFPRIAGQAVLGREHLQAAVAQALRMLVTLTLPAAVVLLAFSESLIRDLFERGAFTAADTVGVATLMRISVVLLIGAALGELVTKTFYVLNDSRTPTVLSAVLLVIGAIVKLSIVRSTGIHSLALITSLTVFTGGMTLTLLLVRQLGSGILEGVPLQLAKSLFATGVAAGVGTLVMSTRLPWASVFGLGLGAGVYFLILGGIDRRSREFLRHLWSEVRRRSE